MRRLHRALLVPAFGTVSFAAVTSCTRAPSSTTQNRNLESTATNELATLPAFADEPFTLRDPKTAMTLRARVREVAHVPVGSGPVRFRHSAHGIEDFVNVAEGRASMTYALSLDSKTAALRLVANQLEIVDSAGFPRFRAHSPILHDAHGRKANAIFSVEGCAVDRDPAPPFRRDLPSPGARDCVLRVSWDPRGLEYPVEVDPTWETTGAMATPRYEQIAMTLPSGDVLVAGGLAGVAGFDEDALASTEIYSGGTWAAGDSMIGPRTLAAAAALPNGDILVSGGLDQTDSGQTILDTAEIYSVTSGTWSSTGSLGTARSGHTATPVGDGTILIAGGYDNSGTHFSNAELFSGGTFSAAGSINTSRFYHAAAQLSGNRVLLGGGTDPFTGAIGTLELYTAGVGWSAPEDLATMSAPRTLLTATAVASDRVVFIGGYNDTDGTLASAETYDATTNAFSTASGSMTHARYHAVATSLADGRVLVVGGEDLTANFSDGEIYDPTTTTFLDVCGGGEFRAFGHTANLLADGNVLVAGGYDYFPARILDSADVLDMTSDAGADDAGTCRQVAPPPVDAGSDDGGTVSSDGGPHSDAGSDASVSDGGSRGDASTNDGGSSNDETDSPIFVSGGGCNASGLTANFSWISILGVGWALRRRRRSRV